MALPEIVKDIEARIIRPSSTDNAIVRFDGATGQVQNTNNTIDDNDKAVFQGVINSGTICITGKNFNNEVLNSTCGGTIFGIKYDDADNLPENGIVQIRGHGGSFGLASHCSYTDWTGESIIGEGCFYKNAENNYSKNNSDPLTPTALILKDDGHLKYYIGNTKVYSKNEKITMNEYEVLHTGNFNLIDSRYVLKSGDIMTGMLRVNNAPIFGYRYGQSADAPAFILDKPSSHYSGIGANGSADTIYFGAVNTGTFNWEKSYKQKWVFNGSVTADTFNGKATQDGNGNIITSTYLPLSGGTMTGRIDLPYNLFSLQFREGSYITGTYYGTLGNECLAFVARQAVTSFMFVTGSDIASWTSSTWNSSSPALQIKEQSVYVNSLIANGVSPSYNFYVNGTSYFNGTVIATMLKGDTSVAGILPQQSNEINFSSSGSTIWFGYRTLGSNAVSVYNFGNSAGSATGRINAGTVYGAVWNDYAEYRSSDPVEPGRVICETGNGTLKLSTERLQPGANVVSDTFGFAIGETENCKTPIAVSGRALVYTYEDRYSYAAGDPVCAGPGGTVSKMSRKEVMMYPDRIVGTVSEIPEYEHWGTGNVEVNGRIWIKVK